MHEPLACVMCMIGPTAAPLVIPVVQATVIVAPILFRDQVRRAWRAARHRPDVADPDDAAIPSDEDSPDQVDERTPPG